MLPATILEQCAPAVHPVTMSAVVRHESGGNPLAIHNNTTGRSNKPASVEQAVALASGMIQRGESVDLGLAQINSANLSKLGLSIKMAFDPCRNLAGSQTILLDGWHKSGGNLKKMLSAYNTGKTDSVIGAQYANAVYKQAGVIIPAIPVPSSQISYDRPPPIRVKLEWTPAASPFAPIGEALQPHW